MSTDTSVTSTPDGTHQSAAGETSGETQHHGHSAHWTDAQYVLLAVFLAVVTGLEIYASYADWLGSFLVPSLLIMMLVKFVAVVLFFMHLRFDSKLFSVLFYSGLGLALLVYLGALLTFEFFVN